MHTIDSGRVMRRLALLFLFVLTSTFAWSQQLTTVAVFDLDQVLLNFYQDSSAVREYQEAEQEFRADLRRAEQLLNDYQARRSRALDRDDSRTAQRLREDIRALEEEILALREGWFAQQEELQDELGGDEFNQRLYDTIGFVAEDNGYTAVLEASQLGTALFWYSPEIDITEEIIQELLARFR
jgi:Skp family chaperone for outer membrane proteins